MIHYNPRHAYPSSEELLDSDETQVDNELQDLIPGMLKAMSRDRVESSIRSHEALDRVEQQNAKLTAKLRELGIDPNKL